MGKLTLCTAFGRYVFAVITLPFLYPFACNACLLSHTLATLFSLATIITALFFATILATVDFVLLVGLTLCALDAIFAVCQSRCTISGLNSLSSS
jgi:hypothetical protein